MINEILKLNENIIEVRIRTNLPIIFKLICEDNNKSIVEKYYNYETKKLTDNIEEAFVINKNQIERLFGRLVNYSAYHYEEEIKHGYITLDSGSRVGITGEIITEDGKIKSIRNISSINIRVSRDVKNVDKEVFKYLLSNNTVNNSIIVSPPMCGKTTMLRNIAKVLSDTYKKTISIVDERNEISGTTNGIRSFYLGSRTDVLVNSKKSEGLKMLIRSMSPEVIICDELGDEREIEDILNASASGISMIFTMHGRTFEDIKIKIPNLLEKNIFKNIIFLSSVDNIGNISSVKELI